MYEAGLGLGLGIALMSGGGEPPAPVPEWLTLVDHSLDKTITLGNFTAVMQVKKSQLIFNPEATFSKARITWNGRAGAVYIGHRAASGDIYDFASTPVAVTWGGSPTLSAGSGVETVSDEIAFAWDGTSDILVAVQHNASGTIDYGDGFADIDGFYLVGSQQSATVNKSGYNSAPSTSYGLASVEVYQDDAWPVYNVVCDGNSLTAGTGSTGNNNYPALMKAILGSAYRVTNLGVPSATTVERDSANETGALVRADAMNIAVLWEFTNDMTLGGPASAVDAEAHFVTWCNNVRAEGYEKIIAISVLPRNDFIDTGGAFETKRLTVNAYLAANWPSFADGFADVVADSRIGDKGDEEDITYYSVDKVHLNNAGYGIVAGIVAAAVQATS